MKTKHIIIIAILFFTWRWYKKNKAYQAAGGSANTQLSQGAPGGSALFEAINTVLGITPNVTPPITGTTTPTGGTTTPTGGTTTGTTTGSVAVETGTTTPKPTAEAAPPPTFTKASSADSKFTGRARRRNSAFLNI